MVGLTQAEANVLIEKYGPNQITKKHDLSPIRLLIRQFTNPTIIILLISATMYGLLGNVHDALLIFALIIPSGLLTFAQEFRAESTMQKLANLLKVFVKVYRSGNIINIPSEEIVPGDVIHLIPGDVVPADLEIITSSNLSIDESVLTGESSPKSKATNLDNKLFAGTHVLSGSCQALVLKTGKSTSYGEIIAKLEEQEVETTFERGTRQFGFLVARAIAILVVFVFVGNLILDRPALSSLLFSLALAVGLTPQMLPVIISVCLSAGARKLSGKKVLIRRLDVIEDLGTLHILCADKTGTLTTGNLMVAKSINPFGEADDRVKLLAYENAVTQESSANVIDHAIAKINVNSEIRKKKQEIEFSFERRRVSVIFEDGELICKGAFSETFNLCTNVRVHDLVKPISSFKTQIIELHREFANQGFKVIAVASGTSGSEENLVFEGMVLLEDPAKLDAKEAIVELAELGVQLVIITGDSKEAAVHTARTFDLPRDICITGKELKELNDQQLQEKIEKCRIFAEIDPIQKARIVNGFSQSGNTVGFIGDGINDVIALRSADVSITVDGAVDVAKSASSVVLLEKDLKVIADGIKIGRRTFENTMKYIRITISASFGNVLSMALASFFLPFLPMLPTQILLLNFLSDLPSVTVSWDKVDPEDLARPSKWRMRDIGHFMVIFGLVSTAFDLILFITALSVLNGDETQIRSAWFATSLLTEVIAILVLRTRRSPWHSSPGKLLFWLCILTLLIAWFVPVSGVFAFLGLTRVSWEFLVLIAAVSIGYGIALEFFKRFFSAGFGIRANN